MTDNTSGSHQDYPPGYQAMALEMMERLLKDADNPGAVGQYIAEQMRELTGASTVVLLQCSHTFGSSGHAVFCVNPERRRMLAEKVVAGDLPILAHELDQPEIWGMEGETSEANTILQNLDCGLSIAVPLKVGTVRVGALLLLGLPDPDHSKLLIDILSLLSTLIALVFRNTILYEKQESIIKQRTIALKAHETRLRQSQKMEAIGTLAGGIAHDFNNILSAIIGYTELAYEDLPEHSGAKKLLVQVLNSGERARDLIRQILSFSRLNKEEKKALKLPPVIREVAKLLRASIPATVDIQLFIQDEDATVMADPIQMQQVLMNLCTNAAYAMKDQGGIIEIHLQLETISHQDPRFDQSMGGEYYLISIHDSGPGIDEHIIHRIFEPFFTTKDPGEGTGMGLSVVHGIIKNHKGIIDVKSKKKSEDCEKSGTTFFVYLPAVKVTVREDNQCSELDPILGGNEHILLVDDEEVLIDLGKQMLTRWGYTVTTCLSGIDALKLFQKDPDQFDLMITDLTMPRLTGIQLAKQVKAIRQDLPIVLCTGFSTHLSIEAITAAGINRHLLKPLVSTQLAGVVRGLLDEFKSL
jgi:signal transduction histidine kinase